jgi:hypothetical protein
MATTLVPGPTRADTWRINLRVEHPHNPGSMIDYTVWDKKTGGGVDSEERIYYPGGMVPPISLGGRKTVANVTLQRLYRLQRDHDKIQQLIDAVGVSAVTISQHPMDIHGNVYGSPIVYNGTLKTVNLPDHDSEGNDPAMIEVVVSVAAPPTST